MWYDYWKWKAIWFPRNEEVNWSLCLLGQEDRFCLESTVKKSFFFFFSSPLFFTFQLALEYLLGWEGNPTLVQSYHFLGSYTTDLHNYTVSHIHVIWLPSWVLRAAQFKGSDEQLCMSQNSACLSLMSCKLCDVMASSKLKRPHMNEPRHKWR